METAPLKEIVNELLSSLENLEAQSTAVLEFLGTEKNSAGKELAPLLKQAAEASNVRYRAARLRMERLFSELERQTEKAEAQKKDAEQSERQQEKAAEHARETQSEIEVTDHEESAASAKPAAETRPDGSDVPTARPHPDGENRTQQAEANGSPDQRETNPSSSRKDAA